MKNKIFKKLKYLSLKKLDNNISSKEKEELMNMKKYLKLNEMDIIEMDYNTIVEKITTWKLIKLSISFLIISLFSKPSYKDWK